MAGNLLTRVQRDYLLKVSCTYPSCS